MLERDEDWRATDRGQVATRAEEGAAKVVERLADVARSALAAAPDIATIGIGVPGPYYPERGSVRDLTNFPGDWDDVPIAPYVGVHSGVATYLINDARAFGLAELRMGSGRGVSSMVGLTLGTGLGGVIVIVAAGYARLTTES